MSSPFFALLVTETQTTGTWETISEIPVDVWLSRSYKSGAEVTESPVESGARTTDHVHLLPDEIDLEGFISDSPLAAVAKVSASQSVAQAESPTKGDVAYAGVVGPRALSAFDAIENARIKRYTVTVMSELQVYDDMIITSFVVDRNQDHGGDGLWFTMHLKNIRVVTTQSAALPSNVVSRLNRKTRKSKAAAKTTEGALVKKLTAQSSGQVEQGKVSTTTPSTSTATSGQTSTNGFTAAYGA